MVGSVRCSSVSPLPAVKCSRFSQNNFCQLKFQSIQEQSVQGRVRVQLVVNAHVQDYVQITVQAHVQIQIQFKPTPKIMFEFKPRLTCKSKSESSVSSILQFDCKLVLARARGKGCELGVGLNRLFHVCISEHFPCTCTRIRQILLYVHGHVRVQLQTRVQVQVQNRVHATVNSNIN